MPTYRLVVVGKVKEIWYIDAESETDARARWDIDGEYDYQVGTWDYEIWDIEDVWEEN